MMKGELKEEGETSAGCKGERTSRPEVVRVQPQHHLKHRLIDPVAKGGSPLCEIEVFLDPKGEHRLFVDEYPTVLDRRWTMGTG